MSDNGIFQVSIETVIECLKMSAGLAKNIILDAIPRIAAMNWDPICDQYKVWLTAGSRLIYHPVRFSLNLSYICLFFCSLDFRVLMSCLMEAGVRP